MPYGIYLPGRWRQQPPGRVTIERSTPLSSGIVFALSDRFEAVSNRVIRFDSRISRRATSNGAGWYRETELTSGVEPSSSLGVKIPGGAPFTFAILAQIEPTFVGQHWAAVWGDNANLRMRTDSGYEQIALQLIGGDGSAVVTVDYGASHAALSTAPVMHVGMWDGATARLFRNGRQTATSSLATLRNSGNNDFILGSGGGYFSYHFKGYLPFAAAWGRALTAAEVREVSQNPWQLFRKAGSMTYSLPSATPTLSAATVIDITSSGAKPRVTVTF